MKNLSKLLLVVLFGATFTFTNADACTRVTYTTDKDSVVTGRTMDWLSQDRPNIQIGTRNAKHKSMAKNTTWTSKYGSVSVVSFDNIVNSGINEKGLVVDSLWLDVSEYGMPKKGEVVVELEKYPQYLLDNFATVDEVVKFLKTKGLRPIQLNRGMPLKLHYIVTDKQGNNAIIEYVNGEIKIYEEKGRVVLTNDPTYEKMLAIRDYYKECGILRNMPGSSLSQARFLYASGWLENYTNAELTGYIDGISEQSFDNQVVMSVLSLMRGVSTPLGVELTEAEPNNTSTLWRTVADAKNGKFYYDSGLTMTTVWLDLKEIDFTKKYKPIDLTNGRILHGDVTKFLEQ